MMLLEIKNLHATVEGREILRGVDLTGMHREIDAPQDLVGAHIHMQLSDFQHSFNLCAGKSLIRRCPQD